jgi:hypothetical protein
MTRIEWCKLENFQQMCDFIYNKLDVKLLEEVWDTAKMLDKQGNEVTNKDGMCGHPTNFHLTHPDKLIFVDEVGDNT